MKLLSEVLELRGVKNVKSEKGNVYYLVNCETDEGDACQFYCKDFNAIPQGLKKGDLIKLNLDYDTKYKRLVVSSVHKNG